MHHHGTTQLPDLQTTLGHRSFRRRTVLTGLAVAWTGAWARRFLLGAEPARAADSQAQPVTIAPPVGVTFVGPTSDPETLIGIVLPDDEPGAAVAYLCRGAELNVWFTGHLQDDVLELAGGPAPEAIADGTSPALSGRRDDSGVTGEAMLPDRTLTFTAVPAEGIAGLYVTERDDDGMVTGASSNGATLKARQSAATGSVKGIAPFQISGTVIAADGRHFEITIPARTDVAAVFRWVALADGTVRGAGRRRANSATGTVKFDVERPAGSGSASNGNVDGDGFIGSGVDLNQEDGFIESDINF